jgi:hypothetical protein
VSILSTQKRKISYWSFDFLSGDEHFFDADVFCRFLAYLQTVNQQSLLYRDEKQNKAIALESIREETKQGIHMYKVVFKSCKYNHSPGYMSSLDGTERPTEKLLSEGDKELTHMCFRIDADEAYAIFEERRNGVSVGGTVAYLNRHLNAFIEVSDDLEDDFCIWSSIIPPEDFLTALGKTSRIASTELFVENKILGTGYLGLMDEDINSQNDLIITMKAKPRKSLAKRGIESIYTALTTGGTEVSRIRVRGKDINKMDVTIDSLNGKKMDEVTVKLQENGIVDSYESDYSLSRPVYSVFSFAVFGGFIITYRLLLFVFERFGMGQRQRHCFFRSRSLPDTQYFTVNFKRNC